jgi:glycosyltransferase involved in cell wall biosynthesis
MDDKKINSNSKIEFSVIIPAYNESLTLPIVIKQLEQELGTQRHYEVIIIDDGSYDGTSSCPIPSHMKLIRHPYNKGHGATLKTGLQNSTAPTIVVIDADGQHQPVDIVRLLDTYNQGYDLVIGARRNLWKQHHGFGNSCVNILASIFSGAFIPDLTSGLRAINREKAMKFFNLYPNRFCFELTTTMSFLLNNFRVKFIDIEPRLRQGGESKIRALWDGLRFCSLIIKMAWIFKPYKIFWIFGALPLALGALQYLLFGPSTSFLFALGFGVVSYVIGGIFFIKNKL